MDWKQYLVCGVLASFAVEREVEFGMYIYGSLKAPAFPDDADRKTHPYAVIKMSKLNDYGQLILLSVPVTAKKTSLYEELYATADGTAITYKVNDGTYGETAWTRTPDNDMSFSAGDKISSAYRAYYTFTWADFDVKSHTDDSVYLEASEPVPLY